MCQPLSNAADVAGKVVYGFCGACTFATKAKYAQEAGA